MAASVASDAYATWIEELIAEGLEAWFVTLTFRELAGSPAAQQQQMLQCVEKAYALRVTRVIRHPLSARNRGLRPIWLAALDLPIFKHIKQSYQPVLPNDGLHVHAIVLEPIFRRYPECIAEHMWAQQNRYRRRSLGLERIHVCAITHDVPEVTSYLFKQVERRVSADGVLILPRTNDELRRKQSGSAEIRRSSAPRTTEKARARPGIDGRASPSTRAFSATRAG